MAYSWSWLIIRSRGIKEAPIAIEIKSDDAPQEKDLKALRSFKTENKNAILYCFCNSPRAYNLGDIEVLPWHEGFSKVFSF